MATVHHSDTTGSRPLSVDRYGVAEAHIIGNGTSLYGPAGAGTEAAGAVTVNYRKGVITLAAVLNAGAGLAVTLTNSYITASSVVLLNVEGTTATAAATRDALTANLTSRTAGSCVIQVYNGDAGNSTAAPKIHFLIL